MEEVVRIKRSWWRGRFPGGIVEGPVVARRRGKRGNGTWITVRTPQGDVEVYRRD
jgi:hypothetical protein